MCHIFKNNVRQIVPVTCMAMLLFSYSASAVTRYVNVYNSSPQAPYTNWASAAKIIQNALDECNQKDVVIVSNGVYAMGGKADSSGTLLNRAYVPSQVKLYSLNGPEHTIVLGNGPVGPSAIRCAYLKTGAVISGFTLSNGHTLASGGERSGGGVYGFGIMSNCIVTCCASDDSGGGVTRGTKNVEEGTRGDGGFQYCGRRDDRLRSICLARHCVR